MGRRFTTEPISPMAISSAPKIHAQVPNKRYLPWQAHPRKGHSRYMQEWPAVLEKITCEEAFHAQTALSFTDPGAAAGGPGRMLHVGCAQRLNPKQSLCP